MNQHLPKQLPFDAALFKAKGLAVFNCEPSVYGMIGWIKPAVCLDIGYEDSDVECRGDSHRCIPDQSWLHFVEVLNFMHIRLLLIRYGNAVGDDPAIMRSLSHSLLNKQIAFHSAGYIITS